MIHIRGLLDSQLAPFIVRVCSPQNNTTYGLQFYWIWCCR